MVTAKAERLPFKTEMQFCTKIAHTTLPSVTNTNLVALNVYMDGKKKPLYLRLVHTVDIFSTSELALKF